MPFYVSRLDLTDLTKLLRVKHHEAPCFLCLCWFISSTVSPQMLFHQCESLINCTSPVNKQVLRNVNVISQSSFWRRCRPAMLARACNVVGSFVE